MVKKGCMNSRTKKVKGVKKIKAWAAMDGGKILVMWDKDAASWPRAIYLEEKEAIECRQYYKSRGHSKVRVKAIEITIKQKKR